MKYYKRLILPLLVTLILGFSKFYFGAQAKEWEGLMAYIPHINTVLIISGFTWCLLASMQILKSMFLKQYDISKEDNLRARKVYTQINILVKIANFIIILLAIGLVLLSFESVRKVGVGFFASAGVAGIIIGFSAQKAIGTLIAGIQIAFTQPFRLEDAVVVEGEWGWIEEINLNYIVVRIWDLRRLVLPTTYFLETPFQNWTRTSGDLLGSVFLYTDYTIPFDELRKELDRILETTDLWDKKVKVLQVSDAKEFTVETRILVSARNSPIAWDLRVYVREKMIEFIQKNYPDSLPKTRVVLEKKPSS
ncbi:mechanosensitive ion channel family protein [Algoriphagus machipongonensis]|uniref:Transporter, small conductance mechanosensitive ion channel (MscS) family n=1 Tax=Algoriphagus machipongonensis TaxID=388413 RepID=A3HVA2_9BACT|nr:mechanosensitive ion channel family protein [Algoriphagus machipongonensis]EAZ82074.1 transporter, small conductance mechanosensitive ion channel (MscS) family [Algoriphagus machipongonensis]